MYVNRPVTPRPSPSFLLAPARPPQAPPAGYYQQQPQAYGYAPQQPQAYGYPPQQPQGYGPAQNPYYQPQGTSDVGANLGNVGRKIMDGLRNFFSNAKAFLHKATAP